MLYKLLFSLLSLLSLQSFSQDIPTGSCGMIMSYDAGGNRIKREYYCNNTSGRISNQELTKQQYVTSASFEEVDALYPNPTTGRFYITFSTALENSIIQILDANGKVIQQLKGSGTRMEFDLSNQPSGTYFVLINTNGVIINKKVVRTK